MIVGRLVFTIDVEQQVCGQIDAVMQVADRDTGFVGPVIVRVGGLVADAVPGGEITILDIDGLGR